MFRLGSVLSFAPLIAASQQLRETRRYPSFPGDVVFGTLVAQQDYFVDGVVEDIATALAEIGALTDVKRAHGRQK